MPDSPTTPALERYRQLNGSAVLRQEGADFEAGVVPAVISTGAIARDRARILQDGWDFTNYRRNPVVLFAHDDGAWNGDRMPIALSSGERVEKGSDRTVAVARFDMEDEFAQRVLGKVQRGLINATSVRWRPLETRLDEEVDEDGAKRVVLVFVRQELLEWSFVAIPADPGAEILRADGQPVDPLAFAPAVPRLDERAREITELLTVADPTPEELAALSHLQGALSRVLAPPLPAAPSEGERTEAALDALARAVEVLTARMQAGASAGVDEAVVRAVARVTGRSERELLARLEG